MTIHTTRATRHPITADLVYGYEKVVRRSYEAGGYQARLYAVTVGGAVWTRVTSNRDNFHHPKAVWVPAMCTPDMMATECEYVGLYDADKVRKH